LPYARQAGFLASTGTLVANVDADSRLREGWIQTVLSFFEADPSLAGLLVYYDLSPREKLLVHVFYLTNWLTYAINRYILRVGSMVKPVRCSTVQKCCRSPVGSELRGIGPRLEQT
jgi:cellulose synthase/poly-beta-1,6-N-acetylglucosamine synthase-like glycosyltransferase